jgi:hypothetical protein
MSHRNGRAVGRAAANVVEALESRTLFSTIAWTNRGTSTNDSDGFNAQFGGNANQARLCFDRAIVDWEEIIVNFNYSGGGNTFNLTVHTANLGGNIADGGITSINNGKPTGGNIRIDTATTHWLDPSLGDDAEFDDNITNAFAGFAISPGIAGVDLYTTALARAWPRPGYFSAVQHPADQQLPHRHERG